MHRPWSQEGPWEAGAPAQHNHLPCPQVTAAARLPEWGEEGRCRASRPREDSALRCQDAEKGAMVWLKVQQGALSSDF